MACLKLQVPKMVTKSKKVKFQKLMQLVPVLTCFQYIMNPNIFIIRDIQNPELFKSPRVFRSLPEIL